MNLIRRNASSRTGLAYCLREVGRGQAQTVSLQLSSAEGHRKRADGEGGASAPCSLGVGPGDRCVWDIEEVRQLYRRKEERGGSQWGPGQLLKVSQGGG